MSINPFKPLPKKILEVAQRMALELRQCKFTSRKERTVKELAALTRFSEDDIRAVLQNADRVAQEKSACKFNVRQQYSSYNGRKYYVVSI